MGNDQRGRGSPQPKGSVFHNKWLMAVLLSAGLALDYQARVAINSVFPMLRRELGMTDIQIGLTATLFLWSYALLSPLAGYIGDRFPRRTVLIISVAAWNVVTILSGFATSAWQLIAIRMLLASLQVCYMPTALAFITDFHDDKTQGKGIGIFQTGVYVGIFLAGFPAAYVATHLGWRAMFFLSGGIGLFCAGLMFALPGGGKENVRGKEPGSSHPARTSLGDAIAVFRTPSILSIMLAFALFGGASWIVLTYLPLLIYEHYHVSLELAAFQATFYMQVAGIVAEPILGHVSDRWSAYNVKNRFYFCALTGLAGLPALMAIGLGRHRGVLIAGLAVFGMVCAAYDVSFMPMLTYVTSKYQRATAYGYLNLASCLSGGAAAMVAALMMKTLGLSFVVASSGGLFLLVFLVLIVTARVTLPRDILMQSVGKGNHVSNN